MFDNDWVDTTIVDDFEIDKRPENPMSDNLYNRHFILGHWGTLGKYFESPKLVVDRFVLYEIENIINKINNEGLVKVVFGKFDVDICENYSMILNSIDMNRLLDILEKNLVDWDAAIYYYLKEYIDKKIEKAYEDIKIIKRKEELAHHNIQEDWVSAQGQIVDYIDERALKSIDLTKNEFLRDIQIEALKNVLIIDSNNNVRS